MAKIRPFWNLISDLKVMLTGKGLAEVATRLQNYIVIMVGIISGIRCRQGSACVEYYLLH